MQQYSLNALWPEKTRAWPGIGPRLYPDWALRWGPPDWGQIGARLGPDWGPIGPRITSGMASGITRSGSGFCSGLLFRALVPGAGSGRWFRSFFAPAPAVFCPGLSIA